MSALKHVRAVPQAQAAVHVEPPLRNQRNNTTRRNPREHDGGRRRPKTLAILPRSSPPPAVAAATVSTTTAAAAGSIPLASSYSCSESGSSSSTYSHDQDTTASVIPVIPDQLVTDTVDEQQQHQHHHQYMEPICWSGHAVTAAELSCAAYPPYFAPCWPEREDTPRIDHMVGGGYSDSPSPTHSQSLGSYQTPASDFPNFDRGMNSARDGDDVPPPPPLGAHLAQMQPAMAAAAPPITSLDTRDPAGIRDDLGPYAYYPNPTTTTAPMGFGAGYVPYGAGSYGPGSRVRYDWQPVVCMEPPFQGGLT
ncbi:hypothetical protein PG988_005947 [Apiospora saccharicola]